MKVLSCSGGMGAYCVTLAKSPPHSRASLSPYVQRRGRTPAAIRTLTACPFPSPPEQFLHGGWWGLMCVLGPATPAPNQDKAWWSGLNCLSPSFLLPPCLLPFVFFLRGPRVRVPRWFPCSDHSQHRQPHLIPILCPCGHRRPLLGRGGAVGPRAALKTLARAQAVSHPSSQGRGLPCSSGDKDRLSPTLQCDTSGPAA